MATYSHSRLSTFEQCPFKFKLRYLDKIKPEIEQSIESHLGGVVHDTLEWVHTEVMNNKIPTIDQMITRYAEKWEEKYKPNFVIVRKTMNPKDYFNKGVQFLLDYYQKNQPFKENTLEVEKRILIELDENTKLQGFIDRLVHNLETGQYEVHDYKTANNLPTQAKIDGDRQLALYSIAIKEKYGHDKEVCLVWHYLAHNLKIQSRRTNQQLKQLKKETLELIKKIESTTHFPTNKMILCSWCEYKSMCPEFSDRSLTCSAGGKINEHQKPLTQFSDTPPEEVKGLDIW
ncbi:PD-(D/E)XK nuclease family protein [Candidatus Pacearchaeota archaeon]|nr:PD-(D/E)XK nuclease family protein [Candidatus Pacearchaeota archaeon]